MNTKRELSTLSYTNKDFNSIYVELLEYAKKFSYRWDPSISDESDPGVILLKLAALIGDKNNYNIDKNVLELMPNSVTQLSCARQLFDQCGYTMAYYNSAVGQVNFTVTKPMTAEESVADAKTFTYTVPRFTMITDSNNSIVYTTTEQKTLTYNIQTPINVIEGTVSDYTINNDALITTANLDSNNRLYFTESDIAENGIFITNVDSSKVTYSNYEDWYKVDVLETEAPMSKCYKFGLSLDGSLCYIQFPEDVEFLFGEGIHVKYIRTKGSDGNISSNILRQFYVDTTFIKKSINGLIEDEEVSASIDSIAINNPLDILNGRNPETIDEAYRGYRRVKTTFDTLVSTKDYTDDLVISKCASNGFVCDRTNDIQRSYKIKEYKSTGPQLKNIVENTLVTKTRVLSDNGVLSTITADFVEPSMTAFDLCVYALEYVPEAKSLELFAKSFKLTEKPKYEEHLNKTTLSHKSLQHDFLNFEEDKILLVKNKYPILCTIIPRHELTTTEKFEIQQNIEIALCKELNSNKISFSEAITFDVLKETILNSDDRIKHIEGLTTPSYTTWVTYKHDSVLKEMRVDHMSFSGGFVPVNIASNAFNPDNFYYLDVAENKIKKVPKDSSYNKSLTYYDYDEALNNLWHKFRAEIYAKNILAGVSPLYDADSVFLSGVTQQNTENIGYASKLTTNTDIELVEVDSDSNFWRSGELLPNENILLTAPNFVQENNYSSYVKTIYCLTGNGADTLGNIPPNGKYELKENDFIIFFWKKSDNDSTYTYVKYDNSDKSPANFISPSFELPKDQTIKSKKVTTAVIDYFRKVPSGKGQLQGSSSGELDGLTPNEFVKKLNEEYNYEVLVGTKTIYTLKINKIQINNKTNGSSDIYWILNNTTKNDEGSDVYRLFDANQFKYTLRSGEYFLYTNSSKSTLYILGEGTVIERSTAWKDIRPIWEAPVLLYNELISEGIEILTTNNCWQKVVLSDGRDTDLNIFATEMQTYLIGPGNKLELTYKGKDTLDSIIIDNGETNTTNLYNFSISYIDKNNNSISIEQIDSPQYSWEAISILNIDVAPDKPQVLSDHQSFVLSIKDSNEELVTKKIKPTQSQTINVLCSEDILKVGGVDIPLMSDGSSVEFITYNDVDQPQQSNITYDFTSSSAIIHFVNTESEKQEKLQKFRVLPGKYLLWLSCSKDVSKLLVDVNVVDVNEIKVRPLFNNNQVNRYYSIDVTMPSDLTVTIKCQSTYKDVDVTVHPLFSYSADNLKKINVHRAEGDDTGFETDLLTMLYQLDTDQIYDYANTDTYIENPLISNSFLNSKHVYNPYVICEWNIAKSIDTDIQVMKEIR